MSTSPADLDRARVLLVGAGGVGAPAIRALVAAGVGALLVADDDAIEATNLHRQILYGESDVGRLKLDALVDAVARLGRTRVVPLPGRFLPENALDRLADVDVVLDGSDNFATRFLASDACVLAEKPVVHAAAVRWHGTVVVSGSSGRRPCYRCLFEDLPEGPAPDCAGAGVVGPVCGVIGGVAADAVVRILRGDDAVLATVTSFDGLGGTLRRVRLRARPGCPSCGAAPSLQSLDGARYVAPACDL